MKWKGILRRGRKFPMARKWRVGIGRSRLRAKRSTRRSNPTCLGWGNVSFKRKSHPNKIGNPLSSIKGLEVKSFWPKQSNFRFGLCLGGMSSKGVTKPRSRFLCPFPDQGLVLFAFFVPHQMKQSHCSNCELIPLYSFPLEIQRSRQKSFSDDNYSNNYSCDIKRNMKMVSEAAFFVVLKCTSRLVCDIRFTKEIVLRLLFCWRWHKLGKLWIERRRRSSKPEKGRYQRTTDWLTWVQGRCQKSPKSLNSPPEMSLIFLTVWIKCLVDL